METLRTLPALLATLALAAIPMASLADDEHHGNGAYGYPSGYNQPYGYAGDEDENENENENENDQGEHHHHRCVNPAGNVRGWCKHGDRDRDDRRNGGYYGQNSTVQGVVTGVHGNSISILQGLSTVSFDATQALQRGYTNGPIYVTRSITAYGYYDSNGYFHATQIQ